MELILREYQNSAVKKIRRSIANGLTRPLFVLTTAGGKSPIFADIIRRVVENGKRVLWIVHRRNLVYQFKQTLKDFFNVDCGIIMSGVKSKTDRLVQLCTVQTMARRIDLGPEDSNKFIVPADIVMIDEAHHVPSPSYQKILKYYDDKIIIGCSATPTRLDNRPLNQTFTNIVEVISIKELTKQKYISPLRYFVPSTIDVSGIKKTAGDYNQKQLAKRAGKKKIMGDVVSNWLRLAENRSTIVFAVNVKHSIYIRDAFRKVGISAEHLDSKADDTERQGVFDRMESGETKIVTNVMLYNEGLDCPGISACCIVRPTASMGLYRQMVGRALRIQEGKKDAMILDFGGNVERHGFVEDEIHWTLSGKDRSWTKPKKKEETINVVTCRVCSELFINLRACPRCGTVLRTFGKKIEATDDELKEIRKRKTNKDMSWEDKVDVMAGFKWYAESKGYKSGWVAHSYKSIFGVFPKDSRLKNAPPKKPEGKAKNILTHLLIRKAKAYQKEKESIKTN